MSERTLPIDIAHGDERAGMPHRQRTVRHQRLHLGWQTEQPQVVADAAAFLVHAIGERVVGQAVGLDQRLVGARQLHGVEVFALDVFDQAEFGLVLRIILLAHHHRDLGQAGEFGGAVTAFAGENFVTHLALHHHDRLEHAVQAQAGGELFQRLGVEVGARVSRRRDDQAEVDLQVALGLLPADSLGEHVAQAAAKAVIA